MNALTRRAMLSTAAGFVISTETACTSRANSRVSFGVIGLGRRGNYVATQMANNPNAQLTAICDLYDDRIEDGRRAIPGAGKVPAYKDLHEMLARPDLDAVPIATPVFLHPLHFEAAVNAGKHIYCEKPCAASVGGVKHMLAASALADSSKVIQFGFQQRFSPEYLRAESPLARPGSAA